MRLSVTKIKEFKACRRAYELKYIEGLEPVEKSDALVTGTNYHEKLETLYKTGEVDTSDFSKESAMISAYLKYIYPKFKVKTVEDWIEIPVGKHIFYGRVDGISEDRCLVEHKTVSTPINEEYEYNLQWDEQIPMYMLLADIRKVYYTVCQKPTIRIKKGETEEEFFNRMVSWYDEDTDSKIRLLTITRTDKEVFDHAVDLARIADEMEACNLFYKNTLHCFRWGRKCEYASVCMNYDPNEEYIEFERRKTDGIPKTQ